MICQTGLEEISVVRRFVPKVGLMFRFGAILVSAVIPAIAHAQVNIDQGKPAAEIYQSDCATCHKTTRGLADGRNSLMLSSFLREHYTASREQAGALAAYVLGAGGGAAAPAQKPAQEHAKATGEEPKTGEPKTAARPAPEAKPPDQDHPAVSNTGKRDARPATASRGQKQEPEAATPSQQAAPVVATPAVIPSTADTSSQESGTTKSAAAPAESQPGDNTPVPRDNIPD
jgi:hypothetical protein